MRPREFLDVLENPQAPSCGATGEQAEILRTMLVHLFFIDRELDRAELAVLVRVLPERANLRDYVQSAAMRRLDLERLAALFPDATDRDDIVTLAEHAAWGDNRLERGERSLLERLMETLGVSRA